MTGLSGAAAVGLGAFGAHGLKEILSAEMLEIWHTAVLYHFVHTLALFACAVSPLWRGKSARWAWFACWAWTTGILVFCGSLYMLALSGIKILGAVTPIGGVLMILGWLLLATAAFVTVADTKAAA